MYCNPYLPGIHLSVQKVQNGLDLCIKCISGHKIIFVVLCSGIKVNKTQTTQLQYKQ